MHTWINDDLMSNLTTAFIYCCQQNIHHVIIIYPTTPPRFVVLFCFIVAWVNDWKCINVTVVLDGVLIEKASNSTNNPKIDIKQIHTIHPNISDSEIFPIQPKDPCQLQIDYKGRWNLNYSVGFLHSRWVVVFYNAHGFLNGELVPCALWIVCVVSWSWY